MKHDIIKSKNFRRNTYEIIFDGKEYVLIRYNSIGILEVMTYHKSIKEAEIAFDKLFKK